MQTDLVNVDFLGLALVSLVLHHSSSLAITIMITRALSFYRGPSLNRKVCDECSWLARRSHVL